MNKKNSDQDIGYHIFFWKPKIYFFRFLFVSERFSIIGQSHNTVLLIYFGQFYRDIKLTEKRSATIQNKNLLQHTN